MALPRRPTSLPEDVGVLGVPGVLTNDVHVDKAQ
jgi:hypothetical protein